MKINSISVIVPTNRTDSIFFQSIKSIVKSLMNFDGKKELILCVDKSNSKKDNLLNSLATRNSFIRLIINKCPQGAACSRYQGIKVAKYKILLFTDDDCIVGPFWAKQLYSKVVQYGACTGAIKANSQKLIPRFEEYTDYIRTKSKDSSGWVKWISFPNFGIKRKLLPSMPFSLSPKNTTEDMDLATKLRLNGCKIKFDNRILVRTSYPDNILSVFKRKLKHAKGMAFLRTRFNAKRKEELEMKPVTYYLKIWILLSFNAPFSFFERLMFFLINITFCLGLYYFEIKFKWAKNN